MIVGALFLLL